jgi:hypothetical protein
MSRKTMLATVPLGLGAVVLFWAALASRGESVPKPVAARPAAKAVRPSPAADPVAAETEAPARAPAPRAPLTPIRGDGEFAVIEARIRKMEEKLFALETKKAEFTTSNQDLERQLVEKQSEQSARMMAEARVGQWTFLMGLTDLQKQSLMELCTLWAKQDMVRPATRETWQRREDELRGRLSAEQAGKLHDLTSKQTQSMWNMMGQSLGSMAGVSSKEDLLRFQQTLGDWRPDGAMLLPEAYGADWSNLMKEGTSRIQSLLTPEQMARLARYQR